MGFEKYGDAEEAQVFRGDEARVVNEHIAKTGKTVADFDDDERDALHADLDALQNEE